MHPNDDVAAVGGSCVKERSTLWILMWILPLILGFLFAVWEFVELQVKTNIDDPFIIGVQVARVFLISAGITLLGLGFAVWRESVTDQQIADQLTWIGFLQEKADRIVRTAPIGILALDTDLRILEANPKALGLIGGDLEGKTLSEVLGSDEEWLLDRIRMLIAGDLSIVVPVHPPGFRTMIPGPPEHRYVNLPSGGRLTAVIHPFAEDLQGSRRALLFLIDQTTELDRMEAIRQLEMQAIHTEKLATMGLLAAGIAHELNTPLANISLIAESVADRTSDERTKQRLATITDQVEVASRAISEMLRFSRMSEPKMESIVPDDIIHDAIDFVKRTATKAFDTRLELRARYARIRADAQQLNQVFINLLHNAIDAMDAEGHIRISSRSREGWLTIRVEDDGPGIPADLREEVFRPFYTTKEAGKGTGLGLSICRTIVENNQGSIEVSESDLGGACFTLTFPEVTR